MQTFLQRFFHCQAVSLCRQNCAPMDMEQESYWNDLKNALTLKTSMEEAEKLIGNDKDISSKQEELKNILTIFEVDKTLFQSLEIELDSEDEDENLASLNALMRTETEKVSVQAESNDGAAYTMTVARSALKTRSLPHLRLSSA